MKIHPPLIRAIAVAEQYPDLFSVDSLIEHGIDAYVDARTDAGGGMRYAVAIRRDAEPVRQAGREIVVAHIDSFRSARRRVVDRAGFAAAVRASDAHMLAWIIEQYIALEPDGQG